jgi:hypothetical protein
MVAAETFDIAKIDAASIKMANSFFIVVKFL